MYSILSEIESTVCWAGKRLSIQHRIPCNTIPRIWTFFLSRIQLRVSGDLPRFFHSCSLQPEDMCINVHDPACDNKNCPHPYLKEPLHSAGHEMRHWAFHAQYGNDTWSWVDDNIFSLHQQSKNGMVSSRRRSNMTIQVRYIPYFIYDIICFDPHSIPEPRSVQTIVHGIPSTNSTDTGCRHAGVHQIPSMFLGICWCYYFHFRGNLWTYTTKFWPRSARSAIISINAPVFIWMVPSNQMTTLHFASISRCYCKDWPRNTIVVWSPQGSNDLKLDVFVTRSLKLIVEPFPRIESKYLFIIIQLIAEVSNTLNQNACSIKKSTKQCHNGLLPTFRWSFLWATNLA